MRILHTLFSFSLSYILLLSPAMAGWDEGMSAYHRGNFTKALQEFRLAAAQGDAQGQSNLGVMYDNGRGVAQDYVEAVKWYRLAAAQGNASAQYNLGVTYANGQGVAQNNVRAHLWFNLAAVKGDSGAVKNRDKIASIMTQQEIGEAQKLARDCQARNFKRCD